MPNGENSIIEYLTRHPDFLIRHPDLLSHLSVPHGFQGTTVSLLEYQARLLRERLRGLERQTESENLKANARRDLSKHLKPVVLGFYECDDPLQTLDILDDFLGEHYAADWIRLFAAALSRNSSAGDRTRLGPLDTRRRGLFTLLFNNPKPLCDSLQQEHLAILFGEHSDLIRSSLLLPFRYLGKEALLAVGSAGWRQYQQSVELDILTAVIEILSRLTEPAAN